MQFPDATVIVCSTARLARSLRTAYDRAQREKGLTQWRPLQAVTLEQWLNEQIDAALLAGEIKADEAPQGVLSTLQERILWERAIGSALAGNVMEALFDKAGLASAAQEANRLMVEWDMSLAGSGSPEETQQFLRWREDFRKMCGQSGWLESARYFVWQVDCLASGTGELPAQLMIAGYDRVTPQEQRLFDVLAARGVTVQPYDTGQEKVAHAVRVECADRDAECRAAVAWAQKHLQANREARLAIVVPELGALRQRLSALLDEVLHPDLIVPSRAEAPRCYDFSLGVPLSSQPLVATALDLLYLEACPQIQQPAFGNLLHQPYWSAGVTEADARALLDAHVRQYLPHTVSFGRLLRSIRRYSEEGRGLALPRLFEDLQALAGEFGRQPVRQLPSSWAKAFMGMLRAAGWPGERGLSSHEYQARIAFDKALQALAGLDAWLGSISAGEAARRFNHLCREQIFQPEAAGNPSVRIMGMLENAGERLDAVWVMGMNDHLWPPPPRPNPLLPPSVQRAARVPNADAAVQAEFAAVVHHRLLKSAAEVTFSSAKKEGDRQLRLSPLLADIPLADGEMPVASTLVETLTVNAAKKLLMDDDHQAPPVAVGEKVSGGTGLLRAQAIDPAWAYYQYRLGVKTLKDPVNGLEAAERGTLVHGVLEHFWRGLGIGSGLQELRSLSPETLQEAVSQAADQALQDFSRERFEPLSPAFSALERDRLARLAAAWLELEKTRPQPFRVMACEQEETIEIEGISIKLVIDRIDVLEDGRLVLIDYKTGSKPDERNWAEVRITEPQLPVYAALVLRDQGVAAVAFALVRTAEHGFSGIAAEDEILPGVARLQSEKVRKTFGEEIFPDWPSLMHHWKSSIEAIAREIRAGEAANRFDDESQLAWCEVKPLLRLPERQLQFERLLAGEGGQ